MTANLAIAERQLDFSIPLELLGEFYATEPGLVLNAIQKLAGPQRARLVLACRRRPELSGLASVITDLSGEERLCNEVATLAGDLAARCRQAAHSGHMAPRRHAV